MKSCFYLAIVISVATITAETNGQDSGIFSGRGLSSIPLGGRTIDGSSTRQAAPVYDSTGRIQDLSVKKPRWPKILDFSNDNSTSSARRPFSDLFKKPSFDLFKNKPGVPEIFSRPKSLADLFPKRDPSKPNLLQQMNAKSKDFFSRTSDWAAKKNLGLREKSNSTWDNVINDFRGIESKAKDFTVPAQPNIRTAESLDKPRIRF